MTRNSFLMLTFVAAVLTCAAGCEKSSGHSNTGGLNLGGKWSGEYYVRDLNSRFPKGRFEVDLTAKQLRTDLPAASQPQLVAVLADIGYPGQLVHSSGGDHVR